MSFESHMRPWIDPEEALEPFQEELVQRFMKVGKVHLIYPRKRRQVILEGYGGNGEWIFDPAELTLADYLEARVDE